MEAHSEHYGSRLHHHWRASEGQLLFESLPSPTGISVSRIASAGNYGMVVPVPAEDSYALSLELIHYERGELWLDGKPHRQQQLWKGHSAFFDLRASTEAYLLDPFDFLHFHMPRRFLIEYAKREGLSRFRDLEVPIGFGMDDPIIAHLGATLIPAIDRAQEANRLFVDHVTAALTAHILGTYGGNLRATARIHGGLPGWQLRKAKELIESKLDGDLTIADIALECGLTPSYFSRQFARSTGLAPHRWLLKRRVEKAKSLMRETNLRLSEIALACGFADQSHFTRVFSGAEGTTPRLWRAEIRSRIPSDDQ